MLKDPYPKAATPEPQFERFCPECGHTVSEFTVTCPTCGTKLKKGVPLAKIITVFVIMIFLSVLGFGIYLGYKMYSPEIGTSEATSLQSSASIKSPGVTYDATHILPENIEGYNTSVRKISESDRTKNGCGQTTAEGSFIKSDGVLGVVEVIECDSEEDAKQLLPEIAQKLMVIDNLKTKRLKKFIKVNWAQVPNEPTICLFIWQQNRFAITVMAIDTEGGDSCDLGESIANSVILQSPV